MHIMPKTKGFHVSIVHHALDILQPFVKYTPVIAPKTDTEKQLGFYGETTALKVLYYKKKLAVINNDYQNKADNIVGIMTMRSLDYHLQNLDQHYPGWTDSLGFG
jgi:hypothetical protein